MPWLVCIKGDDNGAAFELRERELILGRAPQCDIHMMHSKISGQHCTVQLKGSKLIVKDLKSSNGVKVNGKRIRGKSVSLRYNQQFALGEDVFRYVEHHNAYVDATGDVADALRNGKKGNVMREYTKEALSEAKHKRDKAPGLLSRLFGRKK